MALPFAFVVKSDFIHTQIHIYVIYGLCPFYYYSRLYVYNATVDEFMFDIGQVRIRKNPAADRFQRIIITTYSASTRDYTSHNIIYYISHYIIMCTRSGRVGSYSFKNTLARLVCARSPDVHAPYCTENVKFRDSI